MNIYYHRFLIYLSPSLSSLLGDHIYNSFLRDGLDKVLQDHSLEIGWNTNYKYLKREFQILAIKCHICKVMPTIQYSNTSDLIKTKVIDFRFSHKDPGFKDIVGAARNSYRDQVRYSIAKLARQTMRLLAIGLSQRIDMANLTIRNLFDTQNQIQGLLFQQLYYATRNQNGEVNPYGGLLNLTHMDEMAWSTNLDANGRIGGSATVEQLLDEELFRLIGKVNVRNNHEHEQDEEVEVEVTEQTEDMEHNYQLKRRYFPNVVDKKKKRKVRSC